MKKFLLFIFAISFTRIFAQVDDLQRLADSLDALNKPTKEYVHSTFKGTRVINFPSVETVGRNALDFRIQHRFGEFNSGAYNAFGLDGGACIRLALDYGIRDWLSVGIGRTSIDKLADASVKVKILKQTTDNKMPVTLTWMSGFNYTFLKDPNKDATGVDKYKYWVDRISYSSVITLGRKFSTRFSLEIHGFWIHYNIVDNFNDLNDMFAVGISGRYKVTKHMAITFEYAKRLNRYSDLFDQYYDPLGIGIDLETGGHVFQMHFTNQFGMNEVQYIPYTSSNWFKMGIRLGFNISRVFQLGHSGGNGW
ncbi:MAG: hypothetical protein HY064_13000 [Bacteroidetes bacterium]|nr:hypothetical protein [Bacteroidota bacterium]